MGKRHPRVPSVPGPAQLALVELAAAGPDGSALVSAVTLWDSCSTLLLLSTTPFPAVLALVWSWVLLSPPCVGTGQACAGRAGSLDRIPTKD